MTEGGTPILLAQTATEPVNMADANTQVPVGMRNNTSAIAHHRCIRAPKRFNPCLEPNRRPHADLIILPTEEIFVAAVLAVQVIYPRA